MRVALCLSGQPRSLEQGYHALKSSIIGPYDADVFVHTWFDKEAIGQPLEGSTWNASKLGQVQADTENKILDLYSPKNYLIEPQREFDVDRIYTERIHNTRPFIIFSMFYSVKESNRLKSEFEQRNGFLYDWVIRCRFDLGLRSFFDLKSLYSKELFCPDHCQRLFNHPIDTAITDQFAFSSSKNMDIYSTAYDFIDDYYRNDRIILTPERVIAHHLAKHGIKPMPVQMEYELIRS